MKKKIKFILLSFALSMSTYSVYAQKVGTTSMQFLKVMPCARATAMGDAYVALATGAEAVYWNPAGIALTQGNEFSSSYIDWIFDFQQGALSYAISLGDFGALGFQAHYVDYGTIEEASIDATYLTNFPYPGLTGRQFKPYSYLIGITYGRSLTDRFATGITVKYAHESLFDRSVAKGWSARTENYIDVNTYSNGILFDLGFLYDTGFRTIRIATSVQNFGANLKYAQETSSAPLQFRLGIAADLIGFNSVLFTESEDRLTASFDLFQPNDYSQQMHAGLEYEFFKMLAFRIGYKFNYDSESYTAGAGIHQRIGDFDFSFDYSFGSLGKYLGNVHRISLGARIQ